jgi:hypothetical protein
MFFPLLETAEPPKRSTQILTAKRSKASAKPADNHVCLFRRLNQIKPALVNDAIYKPIDPQDPEIERLAEDMRVNGVLEPIVITTDNVIISGHRRRAAAIVAGLSRVPVRVHNIDSKSHGFVPLLVSFNAAQREKTRAERFREEVILADPDEAYQALIDYREQQSATNNSDTVFLRETKTRKTISPVKQSMVDAVIRIIAAAKQGKYLPVTVRFCHYKMLNEDAVRNTRTGVPYINNLECYKDLCDLIARMRLCGLIPFSAVCDESRPVFSWDTHLSTGPFMRRELEGFLKGFRRNLQQSQPNLIEAVIEKNSIIPVVKSVVGRYGITLTSGKGYCSLEPRYQMACRFKNSGKEKLIVVVAADHDPEGEDIPHSFARSMRDDFGIENIECIKAALTASQVASMDLPSSLEAKTDGARFKRFAELYGTRAVELEALNATDLQEMIRTAIDSVLDVDAFNAELEAEKDDAVFLASKRITAKKFFTEFLEADR